MKRLAIGLLFLLTLSAVGANDVLQTMKVKPADASQDLMYSLINGSVSVWRVRETFRKASPEMRASLVEQTLIWTKAYVSSPQFAKDYAAFRENEKPQPPERTMTVDQELAEQKKQRDAELAEAKKNIASMPAEYRKMAEEGYKASVEAMKQMDTPEFRKMEREGLVMQRKAEDDDYADRLAQWKENYPENPRQLVKIRLQEFLAETANVDYAAKLNGRKFANAAYESKSSEWKLAYRAGREATEKARAFAQGWLKEL
jgi:hypothetical protein